jgi:hypothetical protein
MGSDAGYKSVKSLRVLDVVSKSMLSLTRLNPLFESTSVAFRRANLVGDEALGRVTLGFGRDVVV